MPHRIRFSLCAALTLGGGGYRPQAWKQPSINQTVTFSVKPSVSER
jgi:hypothetical protein